MKRFLLAGAICALFLAGMHVPTSAGAAPSVVATSQCTEAYESTLTCTFSHTPSPNDVLVEVVSVDSTASPNPASSQKPIDVGAGQGIFYRVVPSPAPSNQTFTVSSSAGITGLIVEVSGINTTTPVDVHTVVSQSSRSVCTTSSVSPTQAGDEAILWAASETGSVLTGADMTTTPSVALSFYATNASGASYQDIGVDSGSSSIYGVTNTGGPTPEMGCGLVLLNPVGATAGYPGQGMVGFGPIFERLTAGPAWI